MSGSEWFGAGNVARTDEFCPGAEIAPDDAPGALAEPLFAPGALAAPLLTPGARAGAIDIGAGGGFARSTYGIGGTETNDVGAGGGDRSA